MAIPFIYVNGELSMYLGNKAVSVNKTHPKYKEICVALKKNNEKEIIALLDDISRQSATIVNNCQMGNAEVKDGAVYFKGELVNNDISAAIISSLYADLPIEPLLRFLENVSLNPSYQSQKELYNFIETAGLFITEDGHFLAYKAVRNDFFDKYSGSIDNSPGNIVEMERSKVDDNRHVGCSKGLHAGSIEYINSYGNANDKIIIVKIHPKDVVSVPEDSNHSKIRVCRYEVLREYDGPLYAKINTAKGQPIDDYEDTDDDDWYDYDDDDYDDEDYDDECTSKDVSVTNYTVTNAGGKYSFGTKPSGEKFWNHRDSSGRFAKK